MPELKEETGDKVYWCVRIQWWEKVKMQEAWWLKGPEAQASEEVYASALTDVIVEMMNVVHDGISSMSENYYAPSGKSAIQIKETTARWK